MNDGSEIALRVPVKALRPSEYTSALIQALRNEPELFHTVEHLEGRHATAEELALAHDPAYVALVERVANEGGGRLDNDTVESDGSWDAGTAGTGCVLDAIDRAMAGTNLRSFCAVRPPGHHALRDRAMGFCLFGNVAVGAHYARARHSAGRILIVDWDVHHGNGTQALVENEPDIHFVSMHQWPWYPGTGAVEDRGPLGTIRSRVSRARADLVAAVADEAEEAGG